MSNSRFHQLYYKFKYSHQSFGYVPTGDFNVQRLFEQKPYWRKLSLPYEEKRKYLVLADWTASGWSPAKKEIAINLIAELLRDGFKIYVWQTNVCETNDVVPLTNIAKDNFNNICQKMTPVRNQDVINIVLKKYQFERDQIQVLDDYEFNRLLNPNFDNPNQLNVDDFINSLHHKNDILSFLKQKKYPIKTILHQTFSSATNLAMLQLKKEFPDAIVLFQYKTLIISKLTELLALSENGELAGAYINQEQLMEIEVFELNKFNKFNYDDIDYEQPTFQDNEVLQHLLSNMKQLKSFTSDRFADFAINFEKINLNNLENVILSSENISVSTSLQDLLTRAKNIKEITITDNSCSEITITQRLNLKSLEILRIYKSNNISKESFKNLLYHSGNLKLLELYGNVLEDTDIDINFNFNSLKSIKLNNSLFSSKSLFFLSRNVKNLENLTLSDVNIIELNHINELQSLKSLILMNDMEIAISHQEFWTRIGRLENLEELSLSQIKIKNKNKNSLLKIKDNEITEDLNLKSLKNFDAKGAVISANSLQYILARSANLRQFFISEITDDLKMIFDFNLLETAELSIISMHNLQCLVAKSKHLKKLKIGTVLDNTSVNLITDTTMTPNLTSLEIISCDKISESNLEILLSCTSSLKTMVVEECKITKTIKSLETLESLESLEYQGAEEDSEPLLSSLNNVKKLEFKNTQKNYNKNFNLLLPKNLQLSSLKKLTISTCFHKTQIIQQLLLCAPHLESLCLHNFSIENDELKNLTLLSLPVIIFIHFLGEISAQNLSYLLNVAPNLKKLILHANIKGVNRSFLNNLNLSSLESLDLEDSDIKLDDLKIIIAAAPNLKSINLINVTLKLGDDTDDEIPMELIMELAAKGIEVKTGKNLIEIKNKLEQSTQKIYDSLAPVRRRPNESVQVDADTREQENTEFRLNKIFYGKNNPNPSKYRLSIYHHLKLNPDHGFMHEAFLLSSTQEDLALTDEDTPVSDIDLSYKIQDNKDDNLYYGKITLNLDDEWQALPSLSANEKILAYHLDKPFVPCEIKYSPVNNLYYIRSKQNRTITIDFLLKTDFFRYEMRASPDEDPNIKDLIVFYRDQFGKGGLSSIEKGTGQEYLNAINKEKKGSCRHRAIAFMDVIQNHKEQFGLSEHVACRYITNDCHAFIEIQMTPDAPWIAYNLGGYPAKVATNTDNKPSLANNTMQASPDFQVSTISTAAEDRDIALFEKQFEIGNKEKPTYSSINAYLLHLTNGEKKKQLIELSSTEKVLALALELENHCHDIKRPVYYIHSPDNLVCSAPSIKRKIGNQGELTSGKSGQSGPLHDFLTQNQDKINPPILIINYDNFDSDDIVRLNSLLDDKPKADGTDIEHTVVIDLINPDKPGCYEGDDFYSRFAGNISTCPYSDYDLLIVNPIPENTEKDKSFIINLYHASDWEERLLGKWNIFGKSLYFQEGLLVEAIQSGLPIEIKNGLWGDASFCHFIDRIRSLPQINIYGIVLPLSKPMLLKSEGYEWEFLNEAIVFDREIKPDLPILNPSKLKEFFYRYQCDDKKQLNTLPGFIQKHQQEHPNELLAVNLTRALSEDEWAELLTECRKHHVKMNCHIAPTVSLPLSLSAPPEEIYSPSLLQDRIIESTDTEVTICQINAKENWIVIDVSELEGNDLFINLSGKLNKENLAFEFIQTDGFLTKAIKNKNNIILKGQFSPTLADALAPLLLQAPQNLYVVTHNATHLQFAGVKKHNVSFEEKYTALCSRFDSKEINQLKEFKTEAFCKLSTRLLLPFSSDPWIGLTGLSGGIKLENFSPLNSKLIADAFIKERLSGIKAILDKSPYVFITGLTGVGKSTFVEKYLGSEKKPIYIGELKIKNWAKDTSPGLKILFIDEANISAREWSEFQGLLNNPPGILVGDEYIVLSKEHKVVFAGNPLNYGGERKLSPLFENNGRAIVFEPMPLEFIYEYILKPIFSHTTLTELSLDISAEILNIYQFVCACSHWEVLISPRELQMMALMVLSHAENYPNDNMIQVTKYYAHLIARPLVPENDLNEFDQQFDVPPLKKPVQHLPDDFVLTPTREGLYQHLSDLIALRQFRLHLSRHATSESQNDLTPKLYGGLGGIIIEGEPGIGKSELVIAHLLAHGYIEVKLKTKNVPKNAFYRMPISMQADKKERLLLKAFDEGAIVIIDEINSAPMMERLLNDLLMGKKPNGKRPKKPGFMIIGTQNPVSMSGRHKPSNALKRRLTSVYLPSYPSSELTFILCERGMNQHDAVNLVTVYQKKRELLSASQSAKIPNFRDLKRVAKNRIKVVGKEVKTEIHSASSSLTIKEPIELELSKNQNIEKVCNLFSKQLLAHMIYHLYKMIKLYPQDEKLQNALQTILQQPSKKYILSLINLLPLEQKKELLSASLDEENILSRRMFKYEGFLGDFGKVTTPVIIMKALTELPEFKNYNIDVEYSCIENTYLILEKNREKNQTIYSPIFPKPKTYTFSVIHIKDNQSIHIKKCQIDKITFEKIRIVMSDTEPSKQREELMAIAKSQSQKGNNDLKKMFAPFNESPIQQLSYKK